jgi:GH15 family glucan-1,4-alpha-glucosidase
MIKICDGFAIRQFDKSTDERFVANSYLKSNRRNSHNGLMTNTVYYDLHNPIINNILDNSKIVILCYEDDPYVIISWLSYEENPFIVHYAFTKFSYRKSGFFTILFNHIKQINNVSMSYVVPSTHVSDLKFELLKNKFNLKFSPLGL